MKLRMPFRRKPELAPPGWLPAPDGAPLRVYWDGTRWTDHTMPPPTEAELAWLQVAEMHRRQADNFRQQASAHAASAVIFLVIAILIVVVLIVKRS